MAIESKFERVPDDSPVRCQGRGGSKGQCPFKQVEGSKYCPMHGGTAAVRAKEEEKKRIYRLQQYAERVGEIADHDQVKSLREEIGIARIVLEQLVNQCTDQMTIILHSSRIADLVTRIQKLVESCHRLEQSTGMLLDKAAALHLASVIVGIISKHVEETDTIDQISSEIVDAIVNSKPQEKMKNA